ncbi:LPS export ABC transporter permease LptG, partial [Acidobacteria bacterium AH-259-D05]|nr:LPS export ABC transporter permease LptG [Acidobacteria bacterium AH-259-D05]
KVVVKVQRIHRVIYAEILSPSLIALATLTFVVFTREFGRLAEMLIRKNADTLTVFKVVISLFPSVLIFTVPFSFLIGTLIGFSRLSSDSEVVAMRASGISIYQMLWPVFKAGMGVAVSTLLLTFVFLPQGNWTLRQIRHEIGLRPVQSEIKPQVFNEDLPQIVLYVEDRELQSSIWRGVFLADSGSKGEKRIILSSRAYPIFSTDARRLQLHFEEGSIYKVSPETPEKDSLTRFQTLDVPVAFPEAEQTETEPKKPKDKSVYELWGDLREGDQQIRRNSLIELQRRVALPLSALIFAVLGVTLGAHTPRGVRGYGFIVGMVIAFVYYILFASGSELAENGTLSIVWGVWGADLLLGLMALLTLRYSQAGSRLLHSITNSGLLIHLSQHSRKLTEAAGHLFRGFLHRFREWLSSLRRIRLQLTRVIDLYVIRSFLLYFLLTLSVCVSLFYLFTFFELIDDFFENNTSHLILFDYFFYLLPHILMLLVPISVLIATLVTFGLLDKTNQVIALKACGVSVYRIVLPVLTMALLVSAFIFVVQEYVLPYANQRQDNLRNIIKGRPVQTYYQLGRSWIFGRENRLYNYDYFDSERDVFAEISIYQLDIKANRIFQHTYAQRAAWNAATGSWKLYSGWQRSFTANGVEFSTFDEQSSPITEQPRYFEEEVKESSKMTYLELSDYIQGLQQGGFEVDHLKTELYKKISFPLVSFIMSILGVPFSFSIGRRGALHGIAVGVLLGIVYWGAFGVFGILGSNGLLSPVLAAWGPNLLFGAGGFLLLLGVRT